MRTLALSFVIFVLNSICFGQVHQTGTKRIMIKRQMVDVPVIRTGREAGTYYDAHPEERVMDATAQADKPIRDMQKELIEEMRTWPQGYGTGLYGDDYGDYHLSSPPSSHPAGPIDVTTGQFYPGAAGGIINPNTGHFMPGVGGGYIDPKTGRFNPKF